MSKLDMTKVTRAFNSVGLKIKKYSPEILIVTGIVGVVTSTVMACKATTKVNDVIEKGKEAINDVHDKVADAEAGIIDAKVYTPEIQRKELALAYGRTGYELVKLYAPAVTVGVLSLTAIVSSNNILRKRNTAIAAAYAATEKLFKEYRGRVVDRFGKEVDRELRYNIKKREILDNILNEEFEKFFLMQVQEYANRKLKEQGYLFLNDVLEALGFDIIPAGQVVGWTYDKGNPESEGFVSFGIFDDVYTNQAKANFINEYEKSILLDFNHEGNILEYI